MSGRLLKAPAAVVDLDNIWDYIAEDNEAAADKLIDDILETCNLLLQMPRIGRQRPELGRGVLSFSRGRYLILYHVVKEGIELLRVAGPGQDIEAMFE
jgi:toxin ParE1/3/4